MAAVRGYSGMVYSIRGYNDFGLVPGMPRKYFDKKGAVYLPFVETCGSIPRVETNFEILRNE
jgi:hypothetical protein